MGSSELRARRSMRVAVVAALVSAPIVGLAACNSIAGLNDFEKIGCIGDQCGSVGPGPLPDFDSGDVGEDVTGARDTGPDVRADVGTISPPDPRRLWARWPVSARLDAGADAARTFQLDDAGLLARDKVTGLSWEVGVRTASTRADALAQCESLPGQMKLPSRIELATLFDFTRAGPNLMDPIFEAQQGEGAFWALGEFSVNFESGEVKRGVGKFVRCVRLEDSFRR